MGNSVKNNIKTALEYLSIFFATVLLVIAYLNVEKKYNMMPETVVLGIVLTDSEDGFRQELNDEIIFAAKDSGYEIITLYAERTTQSQAEKVRALIIYGSDAIILSPIAESGWDYVFKEASNADVPIITIDKKAVVSENITKASYIGFEYYENAKKGAIDTLNRRKKNIVELYGTVGSSSAKEITAGFREPLRNSQRDVRITYSICGDFMRSKANELIAGLVKNEYNMDAILSHNDGMAIGAVEALQLDRNNKYNTIDIYAFGGSKEVLQLFEEGKLHWLCKLDAKLLSELTIKEVDSRLNGNAPTEVFCPTEIMVREVDDE